MRQCRVLPAIVAPLTGVANNTGISLKTWTDRASGVGLWARICIGAALAVSMWGCGGHGLTVEPIPEPRDPHTLVLRFEKDIQAARTDEVDVLAPVWFAASEASLQAAEEALASGGDPLDDLARGKAQLLAARDASQISRALLPAVMENRDLARKAGAAELGAEYQAVEDDFRNIVRAVEAGNAEPAVRNRAALADAFRRLELQAIKAGALSEVRRLLQQAAHEKTKRLAPQSHQTALARFEQAEAFITRDRYNTPEIERLADQARFYARRHLEIAEQCRVVESQSPETVVLTFEKSLHRIAVRLNAPDLRDHSLDTQATNILGAIQALQHDRSMTLAEQKQQVAELQSRIAELHRGREQQRLVQERIEESYRKVADLFEPAEAALHLRDGQIVIRLRAMKFAVGAAEILPENMALLEKVGRALSVFDDYDVIIEGHTDNIGPEDINEALSERRAEAVRHYLVMNENLPFDRMIAIGYGADRPLTTNATRAGRAVNRRIDLIVIPRFSDS